MENIKSGYKAKNFNKFITKLELKEEFDCSVASDGAGSCACRGPGAYCPNLSRK